MKENLCNLKIQSRDQLQPNQEHDFYIVECTDENIDKITDNKIDLELESSEISKELPPEKFKQLESTTGQFDNQLLKVIREDSLAEINDELPYEEDY